MRIGTLSSPNQHDVFAVPENFVTMEAIGITVIANRCTTINKTLSAGNHGYTVIEILLASGLSMVVVLFAGFMIFGSLAISDRTKENIESQGELFSIQHQLRSLAARAIDVRYTTVDLQGSGSSSAGEGYVRHNTLLRNSDFGASTDIPLMYFNVESAISGNATVSNPVPTAIFFRRPSPDGRQPGQLRIVSRTNTGQLDPAAAQLVYSGITGVVIRDAQIEPISRVVHSVTVAFTIRYFITSSSSSVKIWCPPNETAAYCQSGTPYRDITREIVLSFDNNQRPAQYQAFEFGTGVYLFDAANVNP